MCRAPQVDSVAVGPGMAGSAAPPDSPRLRNSTVYDLVASGDLEVTQIGSRLMVTSPTLTEVLGEPPPRPSPLAVGVDDSARGADYTGQPSDGAGPVHFSRVK